ncbi:MAG: hypothetical protein EPO52_11315 [Herbiconiux sp.]|nr:MAG: hypothetical protein EPO52_11315 [Herbiconiux sp.]
MAMSDTLPGIEPDDLDGHTIEELSDYLDAGRSPADASIDASPGCQIALAALARLRSLSGAVLDAGASSEPAPDESWISGIVQNIGREARAGRSIPLSHPSPAASLALTEGSVRGLIRAAGEEAGGLVVGRCTLEGDVTTPGAPVAIQVEVSAYGDESIASAATRLRTAILGALQRHTELVVTAIDITVQDIHPAPSAGSEGAS